MKTTFSQFLLETTVKEATKTANTFSEFSKSVVNGKFTLDGTQLDFENVIINNLALTSLEGCPIEYVHTFDCSANKLKSLKHCPLLVSGTFNCSYNQLTTLMDSPDEVGHFVAKSNQISSLAGAPYQIEGELDLSNNKLTSLKDIHKIIKHVGSEIIVTNNPIKSHVLGLLKIEELQKVIFTESKLNDIINKYLPMGDLFACQQELIDAGFEEYAQL